MKPTKRAVLFLIFLAGLGGSIVSTELQRKAFAARNSSGTYTLPAGNPVTTKTTINSAWANTTLSDIGAELTNSLDRSGRGAMTGQLQLANGAVSAPGLTFGSENASGLYRAAAGDLRMSVGSTDVEKYASTGVTFPLTTFFNGTPRVNTTAFLDAGLIVGGPAQFDAGVTGIGIPAGGPGGNFMGGSTTGNGVVGTGGPGASGVVGNGGSSSGNGGFFIGGSPNGIGLVATGTGSGVGAQIVGGLQIGSSGNLINSSVGATYNLNFATVTGGTCKPSSQTLTGATVGGVCHVSEDGDISPAVSACYVSATNTVVVRACALSTVVLSAGNFRVRVFQ